MFSRRAFLITGGASIAILGGGFGGYIGTRSIEAAREPWRTAAEGFGDVRLDVLAYAILAPNPHNRQPWLVRLDGEDSMTVYCDLDRLLPETDPPNRQITIGFGAFLELLRQAAAEKGYRADITPFPDGEPYPVLDGRPVARITLTEDAATPKDPLFDSALARRTLRVTFDQERPVSETVLSELTALAAFPDSIAFDSTLETGRIDRLKDISTRAWDVEINTASTHHESTKLTRIGAAEVNANPDGISLHGPFIEIARLTGVLTRENMNIPGSTAFEAVRSFYADLIQSAMAFGWISTQGNSRQDQLTSGAAWVRLNLAATQLGLGMHPISQMLQEFPEMDTLYKEFHEEVGISEPARVQGFLRFGYAARQAAAPRWPLDSRLIRT